MKRRSIRARPAARVTAPALALLAWGCTLKGGPGKLDVEPTFKVYVVEHPVTLEPRTLSDGEVHARVERVIVEEHRTALGPEYWLAVASVVIVNRGDRPLLFEDVGAFQLVCRSGTVRSATPFVDGSSTGGWHLQEHTQESTQLLPGGEGRVRVQAEIGAKKAHDDPVALTFRGQRTELH